MALLTYGGAIGPLLPMPNTAAAPCLNIIYIAKWRKVCYQFSPSRSTTEEYIALHIILPVNEFNPLVAT